MLKLLALDTANEHRVVALGLGERLFAHTGPAGAASSARLIPELLSLLASQGLRVSDLDALAVSRGPGAFTGLRTAISVTQGLAFAARKPVLLLDSLQVLAEDARLQAQAAGLDVTGQVLWVANDARMDELYAAAYRWDGQAWQVCSAPALYGLPALAQAWQALAPQQLAGSGLRAFEGRLPPCAARTWPEVTQRDRALLNLAQAAWARGDTVAAEEAQPLYLRDKVAQTMAERAALAAASVPNGGA